MCGSYRCICSNTSNVFVMCLSCGGGGGGQLWMSWLLLGCWPAGLLCCSRAGVLHTAAVNTLLPDSQIYWMQA